MEKIYKFLRENKIEEVKEIIDCVLGKREYTNPDNIEVDIDYNNNYSVTIVVLKEGDNEIYFRNNQNLRGFLIEYTPMEEKGRLLLKDYIEETEVDTVQSFIERVYNDCYVSSSLGNGMETEYKLYIEFGKGLKVRNAYFSPDYTSEKINVNIEDFYEIISSLEE